MIPQHIYQTGVTNSYVQVSNFEDYTEQKKLEFSIQNFNIFRQLLLFCIAVCKLPGLSELACDQCLHYSFLYFFTCSQDSFFLPPTGQGP